MAEQQCKATLLLAKCNCLLLSAAVQNRLTAGLCHCKYTYGDLLSRQVCAVAQQQCSATLLLAKCSCPLLSAAVQSRLTAGLYHCKYIYGYFILIQVCTGRTAVQGHTAFGKVQLPPAQRCCAKQADSRLVPLQMHLWRFAFQTGVCSSPTAVQCHTAFGKVQLPPAQCCCAKQDDSRLVPLQIHLWRLAFQTGVCSSPTAVQCHTAFGKVQLPPAQCCCAKQTDNRIVPLPIHLWIFAFDTGMQWPNSSARPTLLLAKRNCPLLSAAVQNRLTAGLCHCKYIYGDLLSRQVCAVAQQQCSATLLLAKCGCPRSVLLCKAG